MSKKTYLLNDLVWIALAIVVCLGGLRLGFGSFQQPKAGFMPFLSGLLMGSLAFMDLLSGFMKQWRGEKEDPKIWGEINWGRLALIMAVLFVYALLSSVLGFIIGTILLLIFLFRLMEPRPWWVIVLASLATTFFFYAVFKLGLGSQLPRGFWGF